ncbi:MAG: ATP-binding protein, partial [Chloroflexota bacterium]
SSQMKRRLRALRRRSGALNFDFRNSKQNDEGSVMRYERLVEWAMKEWETRYGDSPYVTIWASSECSNKIAQRKVKANRKIKGKVRYKGFDEIESEVVVPISDYGSRGRKMVLTATAGAYIFKFQDEKTDEPFDVIYVSSYIDSDLQDLTAIALIPEDKLDSWANFEMICGKAVRPRIRRRRDVYIIGGTEAFFEPNVEWDDVVLEPDLKSAIMDDIEAFFSDGVDIYRELKLTPFRKLLLAGVPGTGKTMLCAALAKHALDERRIVVYVSGSDRDGATFEKMQRAFQAVASSSLPTLLIVEEIDAYLRGDDKARILNVLDGIESPNNSKGTLMIATTNYPEAIDDRVFKRPGRLDRIFVVPTIQYEDIAHQMLQHYMADQWSEDHAEITPKLLKQPGAFVREVALHARMLAAHERKTTVTVEMLHASVDSLLRQMKMDGSFLQQRRPLGLGNRSNGFFDDR